MESATPYILFFCGAGIIGSFFIGLMVGWFGNDLTYAFLNKANQIPMHPEISSHLRAFAFYRGCLSPDIEILCRNLTLSCSRV